MGPALLKLIVGSPRLDPVSQTLRVGVLGRLSLASLRVLVLILAVGAVFRPSLDR